MQYGRSLHHIVGRSNMSTIPEGHMLHHVCQKNITMMGDTTLEVDSQNLERYMQRQWHGLMGCRIQAKLTIIYKTAVSSAVGGEVLVADLALCIYTCKHWIQVSISSSDACIYKVTNLQAQQLSAACQAVTDVD